MINKLNSIKYHVIFLFVSLVFYAVPSFAKNISLINVSDNLDKYVVIDARPLEKWKEGHIKGSFSLSWENYTDTDEKNVPYRILAPGKFAAVLGFKGISETTSVVVYGDADSSWGGEGWVCWALSWLGHKGKIYLLDGGFEAWKKNNMPVETKESYKRSTRIYHFAIADKINIDTETLSSEIKSVQIVDTRTLFERIKRRIPGSVHINWKKFFKGDERKPVNQDELIELLKENGLNPRKKIIYYCTGGIRSAYAWTVHELSGLPEAVNYEGGMAAWSVLRKK